MNYHFESLTLKFTERRRTNWNEEENDRKGNNCTVLTCRPLSVATQKRDSIHCGTHFGASSNLALKTKPIERTKARPASFSSTRRVYRFRDWLVSNKRTSHARTRCYAALSKNRNERKKIKKNGVASFRFTVQVNAWKMRARRVNPFRRNSRRYYCRLAINVPAVFFYCRDCRTTRYCYYYFCCYILPGEERISFSARSVRKAGGSNSLSCARADRRRSDLHIKAG